MKRLGVISFLLLAACRAAAQDAVPAPTPVPAPAAPPAVQSGGPDIEKLRDIGSSASLIPGLATPDPSSDLLTPSGGGRGGGRRRNGGAGALGGGNRPRSARSNDLLAARAGADPLAIRVAYRRDKTEAMRRDPGLGELQLQADAAGSDPEKRALLRAYYTRLFAAVRAVDPTPAMRQHVLLLNRIASQRYDPQRRAVGGEEDLVRGQGGGGGGGRGRGR